MLRVVLARAARSARLTTHFDLDFPRAPQQGEYWCHKHRRDLPAGRERRQVPHAATWPTRLARIAEFAGVRDRRRAAVVLHGDARELALGGPYDGVITSPPYPGPDRLPRAAPLRLRAARARRPARARARRGGARDEQGGGRGVRRRDRRRARARRRRALRPRRAGLHRRQRPAGALSRRSSSGPGCVSTSGSSGTSTAARGGASGEYFESILICR